MTGPLRSRLGFGAGRLRAGVEQRNSLNLLEVAIDGGIRWFDTAPSYGNGQSEGLLGEMLEKAGPGMIVATKIGFEPPQGSPLRQALRATLRSVVKQILPDGAFTKLRGAPARPANTARVHGTFELEILRASVRRSMERLRTERLGALLMHEPRLQDPSDEVGAWLKSLVTGGQVAALGVGTGADANLLPDFGSIRQYAMRFDAAATAPDACTRIEHGLFRQVQLGSIASRAASGTDREMVRVWDACRAHDPSGAAFWLWLCLTAKPRVRVLISSTSTSKLKTLLLALSALENEMNEVVPERVAAAWLASLSAEHAA